MLCVKSQSPRYVSISQLRGLNPNGRTFCLLSSHVNDGVTAHMDESYNQRSMCVAGWLTSNARWKVIDRQWMSRIEYERRKSLKHGETPISRYKAADCANRKGEYSAWSVDRQVLLSKKLIGILGRNKPYGIAVGATFPDFLATFPQNRRDKEWHVYRLCIIQCLMAIGEYMERWLPNDRVAVIYDRGTFSSAAQSAFESIKADKSFANGKYIVTMAPMGWEDCAALQPADLLAYEGMKLIDRHARGTFDFRRSLKAVMDNKIPLRAKHISKEGFAKYADVELSRGA